MTAHPFLVFMMAMVVSVSYSGYDIVFICTDHWVNLHCFELYRGVCLLDSHHLCSLT